MSMNSILKYLFLCAISFCIVSHATAEENQLILKKVNEIATSYFNNDVNAAQKTATGLLRYMDNATEPDEMMKTVTQYLTGKDVDINPYRTSGQQRPDAWGVALISVFAREAALCKWDKRLFESRLQEYKNIAPLMLSPFATKWANRVPAWETWCKNDFKKNKELEPIFQINAPLVQSEPDETKSDLILSTGNESQTPKVFNVAESELEKLREASYKNRYKPSDFKFSTDEKKMIVYLNSIQNPEQRKLEEVRIRLVSMVVENLIATFGRNQYIGSIKLKNSTRKGVIALANENTFMVRPTKGGKSKSYHWNELHPDQIPIMLNYFAIQRLKTSGTASENLEKKKHVTKQYLGAAIFADWYGDYPDAIKYAKKAAELSPDKTPQIVRLFSE